MRIYMCSVYERDHIPINKTSSRICPPPPPQQHSLSRIDGKHRSLLPPFAYPFPLFTPSIIIDQLGVTSAPGAATSGDSNSSGSTNVSVSIGGHIRSVLHPHPPPPSPRLFSEEETDWREVIRNNAELQLRNLPKRLKGLGNTDEFRNG